MKSAKQLLDELVNAIQDLGSYRFSQRTATPTPRSTAMRNRNPNPTPIVNISRKATETRTLQVLALRESHQHSVKPLAKITHVARIRKEGEATGPTDDLFQRIPYVTGMGECGTQPYRRGMYDHAKFSSFGDKT